MRYTVRRAEKTGTIHRKSRYRFMETDTALQADKNQTPATKPSDFNQSERIDTPIDCLQKQILACRQCRQLFGFEPRPVVFGGPHAKIVHISQAPGRLVHEIGRPFADPSGKRLRQSWYYLSEEQFYDPKNFYFTVMGHCFPGKGKTGDKKPPAVCYERWTKKELELLKEAKLILIAGREAASRIFPGKTLDELVFSHLEYEGKPCYVLPHPSGLNRGWFTKHPEFEEKVVPEIRQKIHDVLSIPIDPDFKDHLPKRESWQKTASRKPAGSKTDDTQNKPK